MVLRVSLLTTFFLTVWAGSTMVHQPTAQPVLSNFPRVAAYRLHRRVWSSTEHRLKRRSPQERVTNKSFSYYVRVGLAGGIAGAVGTSILYPMDSAKTLRQSNPEQFTSVISALQHLLQQGHLRRVYTGILPAALGAIPSSALYFGAYESMKSLIRSSSGADETKMTGRLGVHALSAASGNVLSSLVFVPKEFIKQQMQYHGNSIGRTCVTLLRERGLAGFYCGYQTTLMRNIPSAMLRFVVYEEIKWAWFSNRPDPETGLVPTEPKFSWRLFAAGAIAGSLASGLLTPVDVLKTRFSTGTCPVGSGLPGCIHHIMKEQGWRGMYAGAGSRMVWSGAFSALGFGTFEAAKGLLGVSDSKPKKTAAESRKSRPVEKS